MGTTNIIFTLEFSILLLLSALIAQSHASSYTAQISPGKEECFKIRTPEGAKPIIAGYYEVEEDEGVTPDDFDVSIIKHPKGKRKGGKVIYKQPKDALDGTFKIEDTGSERAYYSICFRNNARDDDDEIWVGFSLRARKPPRAMEDDVNGPDTLRALKLVAAAAEIHEDWSVMMDHLDFAHNREAVYYELSSSIMHRLAKWTYVEAFLVVGMATGQVMYWKRFFETRRYL